MAFSRNVFINCPFDDDYYPLLKALIFTTLYCDLIPKISETKDGGEIRIQSIQQIIEESKYSIHDLSRIEPKTPKDLPRFNMPLELGMDLGCKRYARGEKKCLILEAQKYRYKQVISDIGGQDIFHHKNEPSNVVRVVRNWIYTFKRGKSKPPSYNTIWDLFCEFLFDFTRDMRAEKLDPDRIGEIPFSELIDLTEKWITTKKLASSR